jgi:hypothetical protein
VQGLFWNNSPTSIDVTICTSVTAFWTGIMRKVMPFQATLSLVSNCGATATSQREWTPPPIQVSTIHGKVMLTLFGNSPDPSWVLSRMRCVNKNCTLHWDAAWVAQASHAAKYWEQHHQRNQFCWNKTCPVPMQESIFKAYTICSKLARWTETYEGFSEMFCVRALIIILGHMLLWRPILLFDTPCPFQTLFQYITDL